MVAFSQVKKTSIDQASRLVEGLALAAPGIENCIDGIPSTPAAYFDRFDLAQLFNKHPDSIHRWEQRGWLTAVRKPNGRIIGYEAEQVAAVAVRIFRHFAHASFDREVAEKLGVLELLNWVERIVRSYRQAQVIQASGSASPVAALALATLCKAPELAGAGVTDEDVEEYRAEACRQLCLRMRNPVSRLILTRAWMQSGLVVRIQAVQDGRTRDGREPLSASDEGRLG